jgi:glycerophosphoryl diester phosphodiesterase
MRIGLLAALVAGLVVPASARAADNPWLAERVLNIAHQGGEDEFPSNTLYASKRAVRAGADMIELDVGVTLDGKVVVSHDTTLDRTTNGHGTIAAHTLAQIRRLDGAYWFSRGGDDAYAHGRPRKEYRWRGIATGKRKPPRGFRRSDFRVPTLRAVMRAFPRTPINVEVKARTSAETDAEYLANADVLARLLAGVDRRDIIVVSFSQAAVERFHALAPSISVAPGVSGAAAYLLGGAPGDGVVAFQLPITFQLGAQLLEVTTPANVARAHADGYAWHTWLSDDGESPATWRRLIDWCVDGVMTARPVAFEKVLRSHPAPEACS